MLRFTAGAVLGWVAARSLPPAELAPPITDELFLLARKLQVVYEFMAKKLEQDCKNKSEED